MTTSSATKKSKKSGGVSCLTLVAIVFALMAAYPAFLTYQISGNPLNYMIPNFLLFTPYRNAAVNAWMKYIKIDTGVIYDHNHVPIIQAKDYTFETLRKATHNWRSPAIVRGLFSNTKAAQKWNTPDYLPSRIGKFIIPVVRNAVYGTNQNDRATASFSEAFGEIFEHPDSKVYLFFPVKSRFNFNGSEAGSLEDLQNSVNDLVLEDLEIDKLLWNGFGTKIHKTFFGSQLIIGQGTNSSDTTTGTGWHCAAGNNWFIQVLGRKRWYFMDPKYSSMMMPLRGGKVNMMTGYRNMMKIHQNLPLQYADLDAGDLLYNPDWQWHTIKNYEGISMGVPIREVNVSLSFRNNLQYSSIVFLNKFMDKLSVDIGGYPPESGVNPVRIEIPEIDNL